MEIFLLGLQTLSQRDLRVSIACNILTAESRVEDVSRAGVIEEEKSFIVLLTDFQQEKDVLQCTVVFNSS